MLEASTQVLEAFVTWSNDQRKLHSLSISCLSLEYSTWRWIASIRSIPSQVMIWWGRWQVITALGLAPMLTQKDGGPVTGLSFDINFRLQFSGQLEQPWLITAQSGYRLNRDHSSMPSACWDKPPPLKRTPPLPPGCCACTSSTFPAAVNFAAGNSRRQTPAGQTQPNFNNQPAHTLLTSVFNAFLVV